MTSWAGAALRSFVWAAIAATGTAAAHDAAPRSLIPQAVSAPVMELQQVAANVFFVQGVSALGSPANRNFISNAGFVITHDSVVVIDALGSPALAEELVAKIKQITPKPISM